MKKLTVLLIVVLLTLGVTFLALADGTETLGPPSIPIASGTGIVAAGTGLAQVQPGTINIDVPAGAAVQQVLLYWEGQMNSNVVGDNTITIQGISVTGELIGGPAYFFGSAVHSSAFRADITGLGLVASGSNTLSVEGLDFSKANNGAGVIVIYDDGSDAATIELRDGLDLAFINFPEPRKSTIAQTFVFPESSEDRTSRLSMFFSSVAGTISGAGADRPSSIEVTIGGVTTKYSNLLASLDGEEWDTLNLDIVIPAGATELTVQAFSRDDNGTGNKPASLAWTAAGLSVPPPPPPPGGDGCTPGYWRNHFESWPPTGLSPDDDFDATFGVDYFDPDKTLGETIWLGGGGVKKVARHGTAALLNVLHPDVDYPLTEAEVIAAVQAEDVKELAEYNELSDTCPAE